MEASSTGNTSGSDFRNFKPMFTLQPVKATREKQLKQWSSIIMSHCKDNNLNQINPSDFPLFSNRSIDRQLSDEGITAVVENMIKSGNSAFKTFNIILHNLSCCTTFPLHPAYSLHALLIRMNKSI
jgi:ESCRT-II complex subunit